MAQKGTKSGFCSDCGTKTQTASRFCSGCGATLSGGTRASAQQPAASLGLAAAVFALVAAVGGVGLYRAVSDKGPGPRAVPGTASTAAANAPPAGQMPPGHPQMKLPDEVVAFLDDLTETAEAAPEDLAAWRRLARARYRTGLLDRKYFAGALEALDHVLELDPDDREATRIYGNVAYDERRYDEAEARFRRYLKLNPDDLGARTDLASAILFQGRPDEAKQMYRKIIDEQPEFVQAHINLGITLHSEGQKDEAMKSLKHARGLASDPAQRKRIDEIIASAEGRAVPPSTSVAKPVPPSRVTSNAHSSFQKNVDKLLTDHRIVGPRITRIEWTSDATAGVRLNSFPMDKMPPVMRNKFKSGMNETIAKLAQKHDVTSEVRVELIDDADGTVMDALDGAEWVGAFDEEAYE